MGRIGHLQAAIEVKSGKIIAYDLSLTPPCAEKTLRVFKMALTAVEGEELQRGKMQELIVDNGTEVANETVRVAAEVLGIQLRYVPPNTPDAKPHIERFFETLNSSFTHTLPGTTFSNPIARGDYDSAAKACFTIEQVQAYFRTWLEGYYHNHSPSNTKQSPNAIWDREMAKQFPPQKYAQKDLDHLTRRIERRRINGGRVSILNLSWTGPGLAEMENRLRPGKRAIIYYDASNLAEVFVALPERPDELFRGVGTWPAYQEHLTHYEHLLVQQRLKDRGEQLTERVALLALWQLRKELSAAEIDFITRKRKRPAPKPNHQVRLTPPAEPSPSSRDFDNVCTAQEDYATFYLSDQNT
jgi:putative transposase